MQNDTGETGLFISADIQPGISLVSFLNEDMPCLTRLTVTNRTGKDISNLKVKVSFTPAIADEKVIDFSFVAKDTSVEASPQDLSILAFNSSYMSVVHDRADGMVSIKAFAPGNPEALNTVELHTQLLPYDTWGGTGDLKYKYLASFVMPTSEGIRHVAGIAAGKCKSLVGYQSGPQEVVNEMTAVFDAIKSQEIKYFNPPASFQTVGQRIRIPEFCLREKQGTCLDMAVLYASVLESLGLNPVVVVIDGHAYAGCFLEPDAGFDDCLESNPTTVLSFNQQEQLLLVECTYMNESSTASFRDAIDLGKYSTIHFNGFFCAVDIRMCRNSGQINPLPIRIDLVTSQLLLVTDTGEADYRGFDLDPRRRLMLSATHKNKTMLDGRANNLRDYTMRNRLRKRNPTTNL